MARRPLDLAEPLAQAAPLAAERGVQRLCADAQPLAPPWPLPADPQRLRQLLISVWGTHEDPLTNIVDVYIRRQRSKVDEGFEPALIHAQRGLGYWRQAELG
jgi:hypothetical protein